MIATRVAACTGRLEASFIEAWIYTYIHIYITFQMRYATERCTGFVCSYFEFLKLNVKYNDVKYAIVYFRKNNN